MNKRILAALALALCLISSTAMAGDNFYYPTELLFHDSTKAYQGYTIFTPLGTAADYYKTYLIDMDGEVVHTWDLPEDTAISYYAKLLTDGSIIRGLTYEHTSGNIPEPGVLGIESNGGYIQGLNWDGDILFSVRHPNHRDITPAEFMAVTGLTEEQMADDDAVETAMTAAIADTTIQPKIINKYNYSEHHDFKKIWNSKLGKYTVLLIATDLIDESVITNAGVDSTTVKKATYPTAVCTDAIAEIDIETGELVWQWSFKDHLIQNRDASALYYAQTIANQYYNGDVEEAFYRRADVNTHTNQGTFAPHFDWMHINAVDYNPERDEIIISSRQWSEIFVINHNTTMEEAAGSAGDFVWRFGSPSNYASSLQLGANAKAVFPTFQSAQYTQLWGQHHVHWLKTDVPDSSTGEHILVFDNGIARVAGGFSVAMEINPYDANGNYIKELDAGYGAGFAYPSDPGGTVNAMLYSFAGMRALAPSKLVTWAFSSPQNFYSPHISGLQRLPNGNTLICSGAYGHLFEVTTDGYVVWEYVSPMMASYVTETVSVTDTATIKGGRNFISGGNVFRCFRYGPDFAGLSGKTLKPRGPITNLDSLTGFGFGGSTGGGGGSGSGGSGGGGAGGGY